MIQLDAYKYLYYNFGEQAKYQVQASYIQTVVERQYRISTSTGAYCIPTQYIR